MQDVQNIPTPDEDSYDPQDDFGSHSDYPDVDETDRGETDIETPPLPPDRQGDAVPVEEPPTTDKPSIDEDDYGEPKRIV